MRSKLIKFLHKVGLYKKVRWFYVRLHALAWRIYNSITGRQAKIIDDYIKNNDIRKIHMGCGYNMLEGWLNTDLIPMGERVRLDVSSAFPFTSGTFDYAYSEHVIEHLPYRVGENMLSEAFRVMKSGGVIRISTPDLKALIKLYEDDQLDLHKNYIKWNAENFIGGDAPHDAISVFNNFVRDWGHVYIYDEPALTKLLISVGFRDVKTYKINKSDHEHLQNLEHESRHPEGFLQLETMTLEAVKP